MTTDKLLQSFSECVQAADSKRKIAYKLLAESRTCAAKANRHQQSIVRKVHKYRNRGLSQLPLGSFSKKVGISVSRLTNVLYTGAAMKPSEAKTLIQAVNG